MLSYRFLLAFASATAVLATLVSVLVAPLPLLTACSLWLLYMLLLLAGVFMPRLRMFADVVWRAPQGQARIALTFDDGPHPRFTPMILDILERRGARGTFFVIGEKAKAYPETVSQIASRGHMVALHGYRHDWFLSLRSERVVAFDLEQACSLHESLVGSKARYYRPAIGQTNPRIARAARALGLTIVGWSARGLDGVRTRPEHIVRRVLPRLEDGGIILLHDGAQSDGECPPCAVALPEILDAIAERKLRAVRIDELLA